jgi:FAD/FMN-containing dehydrogenase
MQVMSDLLSRLAAVLGPNSIFTDPVDKEPHEHEGRKLYRGRALAVLKPRSTAEVAEIVKLARAAGTPLVVHSGNTGLTGGGVPYDALVISTERMNAVQDLDIANATITVGAGMVLADVQRAASDAGMLFPLSLGAEGSCRIGGNVSSNAGGIGVLRYGNMRDLVLGLEVVLADGRIWNGLKKLRKDNAGYDLKHLFIGSEGTLGIVTAASLKLFPKPLSRAIAFVGAATPHAMMTLFQRARANCGTALSAFELLPRFGLEASLKHIPGTVRPLAGEHAWLAVIELTSPAADAPLQDELETLLGAAIEDAQIEDATIAQSVALALGFWCIREGLSEALGPYGASIKHDVSVPVSSVADFIVEATALCEASLPGIRVCAFGHAGDGNIHFNLSQPVGMDTAAYLAQWHRFNTIVHDKVVALHGSIAAEHGIGLIKRDELVHYKDPVTIDLMRTLKRALDPDNLLNPGKVISIGDNAPPALPV